MTRDVLARSIEKQSVGGNVGSVPNWSLPLFDPPKVSEIQKAKGLIEEISTQIQGLSTVAQRSTFFVRSRSLLPF